MIDRAPLTYRGGHVFTLENENFMVDAWENATDDTVATPCGPGFAPMNVFPCYVLLVHPGIDIPMMMIGRDQYHALVEETTQEGKAMDQLTDKGVFNLDGAIVRLRVNETDGPVSFKPFKTAMHRAIGTECGILHAEPSGMYLTTLYPMELDNFLAKAKPVEPATE